MSALLEAGSLMGVNSRWKVWRTVRVGQGPKTGGGFRQILKTNGFTVLFWGEPPPREPVFPVCREEKELDLVLVTVEGLGFKREALRCEIYAQARKSGLEFCPAEVGPQLRLQYRDQVKGEELNLGVEQLSGFDSTLFSIGHNEKGLWIRSVTGDCLWGAGLRIFDLDSHWVFVLPPK